MPFGRPTRPTSPGAQDASERVVVALALIVVTVLTTSAKPLQAQWTAEPPPIDPFARVAREQSYSDAASPNGYVFPAPAGPANNWQPSPMAAPPGAYPQAPTSFPPSASPPPIATPGPQFQDPMPLQQSVPTLRPDAPPTVNIMPEGQSLLPSGSNSAYRLLDHLEANVIARGYYRNDQRIEWSGLEETFGGEADITSRLRQRCGDFEFVLDTEFYINQPYDSDELMNDAVRQSYAATFQVQQFQVSQLALVTNYGNWTFKIGKFVTPFGRTYFPLYSNAEWDAPFIRTEVIGWRETGILARYKSGYFVGDIALTNGGDDLGTQSSKYLVARAGLESDWWAVGCSLKKGNGNGSEWDKEFDNHYGVDLMFHSGPFQVSAEAIYDEYGFGRPGLVAPEISGVASDVTWARSIYYRDVSSGQAGTPCSGVGYYVNLGYADGPWNAALNYGDYYPLYIGTAPDQRVQHRGLAKAAYKIAEPLQIFSVLIVENGGYIAQEGEPRKGIAALEGFQFTF